MSIPYRLFAIDQCTSLPIRTYEGKSKLVSFCTTHAQTTVIVKSIQFLLHFSSQTLALHAMFSCLSVWAVYFMLYGVYGARQPYEKQARFLHFLPHRFPLVFSSKFLSIYFSSSLFTGPIHFSSSLFGQLCTRLFCDLHIHFQLYLLLHPYCEKYSIDMPQKLSKIHEINAYIALKSKIAHV